MIGEEARQGFLDAFCPCPAGASLLISVLDVR